LFQSKIDKGFEQFKRHFFGQSALVQAQIRSDGNNGPPGIIHAFAQQVLPKSTLLAF
jgi:hypothetical protein